MGRILFHSNGICFVGMLNTLCSKPSTTYTGIKYNLTNGV